MYAVPARKQGQPIKLAKVECQECGGDLFFSHDEIKGVDLYRHASCQEFHSWSFHAKAATSPPIEADQLGSLIDDSKPGWKALIPDWARWSTDDSGISHLFPDTNENRCPACKVALWERHDDDCEIARCLVTGEQRLSHLMPAEQYRPNHHCGLDIWTGEHPWDADCRALGWYCFDTPQGQVRCDASHRNATPDLNRLFTETTWDKEKCRFVAKVSR